MALSGVNFRFVAANREIVAPRGAGPNEHCGNPMVPEDLGENSRSVGYQVTLGEFEFLDLGDMTVDVQQTVACPENRLGVVDLLQAPHHAQGVAPELVWALQPTVAVSNNGDFFATGGTDQAVMLWDYASGACLATGVGHSGCVHQLKFSPDDRQLVSVGNDGCVFVWNVYAADGEGKQ